MVESRVEMPLDETEERSARLTSDEDDELRRLHWISRIGALSSHKRERLSELRRRDRRNEIRPPREFVDEKVDVKRAPGRKWYHFRTR